MKHATLQQQSSGHVTPTIALIKIFFTPASGLGLYRTLVKYIRGSLGMKPVPYKKSYIRRKYNQSFELFYFKGFDRSRVRVSQHSRFRAIRPICKN